jgi:hypothetical protein
MAAHVNGNANNEVKFCTHCGTEKAAGNNFCPNCGKAYSAKATIHAEVVKESYSEQFWKWFRKQKALFQVFGWLFFYWLLIPVLIIRAPWSRNVKLIAFGGLLILFILPGLTDQKKPGSAISQRSEASSTSNLEASSQNDNEDISAISVPTDKPTPSQPTVTPLPTATSGPTSTPAPTNTPRPTTTPQPKEPNFAQAIVLCRNVVRESLKAPSTANFPWVADNYGITKDGTFAVFDHVDAQNSFGAMIRTNFYCEFEFDKVTGKMTNILDFRVIE